MTVAFAQTRQKITRGANFCLEEKYFRSGSIKMDLRLSRERQARLDLVEGLKVYIAGQIMPL